MPNYVEVRQEITSELERVDGKLISISDMLMKSPHLMNQTNCSLMLKECETIFYRIRKYATKNSFSIDKTPLDYNSKVKELFLTIERRIDRLRTYDFNSIRKWGELDQVIKYFELYPNIMKEITGIENALPIHRLLIDETVKIEDDTLLLNESIEIDHDYVIIDDIDESDTIENEESSEIVKLGEKRNILNVINKVPVAIGAVGYAQRAFEFCRETILPMII